MPHLVLIEDGAQVGYVDTEKGEGEYTGEDPFVRGLVNPKIGMSLGSPADQRNGPTEYLVGDRLEEYIRGLPEEHDEVEFVVRERDADYDPPG
jgi:hypothetical protein